MANTRSRSTKADESKGSSSASSSPSSSTSGPPATLEQAPVLELPEALQAPPRPAPKSTKLPPIPTFKIRPTPVPASEPGPSRLEAETEAEKLSTASKQAKKSLKRTKGASKPPSPKLVAKEPASVAPEPRSGGKHLEDVPEMEKAKEVEHKRGAAERIEAQQAGPSTALVLGELESAPIMDFRRFQVKKIINESTHAKSLTIQGIYDGQTAVIKLDRPLFNEADVKEMFRNETTQSRRDFNNDIYSSYTFSNIGDIVKATVVCPANHSVLAKYSRSDCYLFSETPDHYMKIVEPFIRNKLDNERDHNQWVYNILDGKSETDRVIMNDPDPDSGFMIVSDLNWSGDLRELNLLAICHRRDIRCIRDLNDHHLTLLKNIMTKGTKSIKDHFKKFFQSNKGQLRSYIHYQPSFYHFHVHFKLVDPSDYLSTDRDNLLSTVINNINLLGDYYKKSTLTYPLSTSNTLYTELKKAKRI